METSRTETGSQEVEVTVVIGASIGVRILSDHVDVMSESNS
jgi:hypothetical protein